MNCVNIMGRLTRDVEIRYSNRQDMAVARFSVAVNRSFKNAEGKYDADFINCVAFGKAAETIEKYFRKGDRILIQGEWRTGNYKTNDGRTVYTNDLNVQKFDFLESRSDRQNNQRMGAKPQSRPQPQPATDDSFMDLPGGFDSEMPFD